jgi:hypothetical protein
MSRISKSQSISTASTTFDSFVQYELRRSTSILSEQYEHESLTLPLIIPCERNRTSSNFLSNPPNNQTKYEHISLTPI